MHSALAPVIAGLGAHLYCYLREPSTLLEMLTLTIGAPSALALVAQYYGASSNGFRAGSYFAFTYLATLATSVIAYRISPFHPLAKHPGPLIAKVTRLWIFYKVLKGKQHEYYHQLHETYGDIVRTGPNHLTIRNVKAIPKVLGPGSAQNRWPKGRRYGATRLTRTSGSLVTIISPAEHSARRRVWDHAFTASALKGYESVLSRRVTQLVNRLGSHDGDIVDIAEWSSFFSIDFMGDLAFNSEFQFLEAGYDYMGLQRTLEMGALMQESLGIIPWVRPFVEAFSKSSPTAKMYATGRQHIIKRKTEGSSTKDIFFYLLNEDGTGKHEELPLAILAQEAVVVLLAGSDTTASALSNAFYYLLSNPDIFLRLRREVEGVVPADVEIPDVAMLESMPFLQAVIQETLRLQPGVPSGVQRVPPSSNDTVVFDDIVVPAHTTVQIPTWSIHRDSRYFSPSPKSFYPDRWLKKAAENPEEEYRHNPNAWMPFSFGPTSCIGKQLAMTEMKMVISALVRSFDFEFAPGWDRQEWNKNLRDHFILVKGKLPTIIRRRAVA